MPSVSPDDLMTAAKLAERLGVKTGTIFRWHRMGRIPSLRLSPKILRFNLADVIAALDGRLESDTGKGVAR